MKTTSFFRLPILSFIISFCVLFLLLNNKLNAGVDIEYRYSPDFMRIIGTSIFTMFMMSVFLHRIKIYAMNIRNIIFILITIVLVLSFTFWLESDLSNVIHLDDILDYKAYTFWYPIFSRILSMVITVIVIAIMAYFVKHILNWRDEICQADLFQNDVIKNIQLSFFIMFYLSVNFIFQRYLYISVYLFLGGSNVSEFYHFSFYLSAMMTILLLAMFLVNSNAKYRVINAKSVITTTNFILLSQLLISIILSIITIYSVQWYFVLTKPTDDVGNFNHYINLLNTMLNSIFFVSVATCLLTYFAGRLWLKHANYLS